MHRSQVRRAQAVWQRARGRYGWLDHAVRAVARHRRVHAGRLAAALAYYGFFAAFALSALGFAIVGWVLRRNQTALGLVRVWLDRNLPWLDVPALVEASTRLGVIALVGLMVTGLAWVRGVRAAVRAVWCLEEQPGRFLVRVAVDLAVLAGLGLLFLTSIGIAVGVSTGVRWAVVDAAGLEAGPVRGLISAFGFLLGVAVNTLLAMMLLAGVPRIKMPLLRVLGPALLVAVGLELLKTVGGLYFVRSVQNPAYQAVASAVGLLLFMYLLNHVVLFAAALTVTSRRGAAVDLASGGGPVDQAG